MICPACHTTNPDGANFCVECGRSLSLVCPSCGADVPPGAKFCPSCGAPQTTQPAPAIQIPTPRHLAEEIIRAKPSIEGERKQVTVLFADVQGSMDLQEEVDAETWHRLMSRFFTILSDGVHRFEGTVDKFTGDGIMAIFGAPIAHEDHAQRACFAALHLLDELNAYASELRRTHGLSFSVRIGINSGEVIVGGIGEDLSMEYTAVGHTVGLASRMESIAEPGRAYLTERTAALVQGYFDVTDLGPFSIKGVRGEIAVSALEGVGPMRGRLDVSRARGLSRFVGRHAEMGVLEAALERALAGDAQIVCVVGDAGVGKSRLCHEFTQRCHAKGIPLRRTHALPHGKAVPLAVVLELLREVFTISDHDSAQQAREKVAGRLLLLDPAFEEKLPLLFDFLGVPDPERPVPVLDPDTRQRELAQVFKRMVHARSAREPAVLLFDDLHWVDPASEVVIDALVEALPGTRTLALMNYRPEYAPGWTGRSFVQQISLRPLGPEAADELLRDLLGTDPSVTRLAAQIGERAAGNPFFLEEIVRTLAEAGSLTGSRGAYRAGPSVDLSAVPSTVEAVVAARIDRLAEEQKLALQAAAVIGREFPGPVLARVAGLPDEDLAAALRSLIGGAFLFEQAVYPEPSYTFAHPLIQEVAYHAQLSDRRARAHGAAAGALIELYPEKHDENAALVAHHLAGSGEAFDAAQWMVRAARWAGASDLTEANRLWRAAGDLLRGVERTRDADSLLALSLAQVLRTGWRLGMEQDEIRAIFAEARAAAESADDTAMLALVHQMYGSCRLFGSEEVEAWREGTGAWMEASLIAQDHPDLDVRVRTRASRVIALGMLGRTADAFVPIDEGLAMIGDDPTVGGHVLGYYPAVLYHGYRGWLLADCGRGAEARVAARTAQDLAQQLNDTETLAFAGCYSAWIHLSLGDAAEARALAQQGMQLFEQTGNWVLRTQCVSSSAGALMLEGRWEDAAHLIDATLRDMRERHVARGAAPGLVMRQAHCMVELGRVEAGLDLIRTWHEYVRTIGSAAELPGAASVLALATFRHHGIDAADEIERILHEGERWVAQTGLRIYLAHYTELRATVARARATRKAGAG